MTEFSDLELVADFLETDFELVERDGIMVSRGDNQVWVHESHGIAVPEDDLRWSSHDYELLWHATIPEVKEEIRKRGLDE